jgi:hypothetical protein
LSGEERYSRGDYAALPTDDMELETAFTVGDYHDVSADDNYYTDQTADGEYAVFLFKNYSASNTGDISPLWKGKSTVAPSSKTVYLQIYNYNTNSWEAVDSDSGTAADTEFTLEGEITSNVAYYYKVGLGEFSDELGSWDDALGTWESGGGYWVSCRVYQEP